ncbi:3-phosphoglycerate dehydrogenase [candidate division bacterium WOR-3 4484_18]|uniref:3-phosphoglycerate dehydrogenase n=1 Tax=candidate division WOR-3 bacterium 4484_18 TaxID=2020626 RepID=A0A257LT58_UNCW3|nr:MAG: 3-phosphoglycerate dehydrogenase [candidate division bacterium WOR-3 4484_18]
MKLIIADPIDEAAKNELMKLVKVEDLSDIPKDELPKYVKDADIMVVRSATKVRRNMIDQMQNMKLIIRGGVGIDNIDVEYAREKGIEVRNTPAASSITVAELTIAHMLAVARHIPYGTQSLKQGKWEKKKLKGMELYGKTVGIIGLGRIGNEVAKRVQALGMKVIAYDPYVKESAVAKLVDLDTLLREADIITIHTPLTAETHHLIGRKEIEKMKDGVILINTARGGVIDESAIIWGLETGKIYGVGLDVYEQEPLPADHPLLKFDNVSLTPHIGAQTAAARERIGQEVVKIVREFVSK